MRYYKSVVFHSNEQDSHVKIIQIYFRIWRTPSSLNERDGNRRIPLVQRSESILFYTYIYVFGGPQTF